MMFALTRPCVNCPFRKGVGETFQLNRMRLREILKGVAFACHKTIDYDVPNVPEKLVERFHQRYKIDPATECWNWTSTLDHYGYGTIGFGPRLHHTTHKAHRLSWEIHMNLGLTPEIHICHSCDNRKCVNPDHLFVGDNTANMLDAVAKQRRSHYRPISTAEVQAMRREYEFRSEHHGLQALADKYGCSVGQVHNIVTMQSRTHYKNASPQQCAGLMAVLAREGKANTIMQIAERYGHLDFSTLDPLHEAYDSWAQVLAAHGGRIAR